MEFAHLSSTVSIKTVSEDAKDGVFEIEGLFAGYGLTIGNAFAGRFCRRLPGAAATEIKIKGVSHEFSTLPGMKEDIVELTLNFKKITFRLAGRRAAGSSLKVKGEHACHGRRYRAQLGDRAHESGRSARHLTAKDAELDIEVKVERGLGYVPAEARKSEGGFRSAPSRSTRSLRRSSA